MPGKQVALTLIKQINHLYKIEWDVKYASRWHMVPNCGPSITLPVSFGSWLHGEDVFWLKKSWVAGKKRVQVGMRILVKSRTKIFFDCERAGAPCLDGEWCWLLTFMVRTWVRKHGVCSLFWRFLGVRSQQELLMFCGGKKGKLTLVAWAFRMGMGNDSHWKMWYVSGDRCREAAARNACPGSV